MVTCGWPIPTHGQVTFSSTSRCSAARLRRRRVTTGLRKAGSAFDDYGRPRILFERHYFPRLTQGRYDKRHPDISNSLAGGYGKFSAQYGKLERAYVLDAVAALESASWGRFQIMGSNYRDAGFVSVQEFVLAKRCQGQFRGSRA